MNTYEIKFRRKNGTVDCGSVVAANDRQARKDFNEIYRHGIEEILSVTPINTDAPATKQQELDTLAKIRELVEELGPNSHVAVTFEGCFEIAEDNICNDRAYSMAGRARRAEKRVDELETKNEEFYQKLAIANIELTATNERTRIITEQKDSEIAGLKLRIQELLEDNKRGCEYIGEQATRVGEAQRRANEAEAEVIRLKAKLYDCLIEGKEDKHGN